MLYLCCSELRKVELYWMSKLWCDGHNLDVIWTDVNMCSEDRTAFIKTLIIYAVVILTKTRISIPYCEKCSSMQYNLIHHCNQAQNILEMACVIYQKITSITS